MIPRKSFGVNLGLRSLEDELCWFVFENQNKQL